MKTKTIIAALALTVAMPSLAQAQAPCRYSLRAAVCTIDSAADQRAVPRPRPTGWNPPPLYAHQMHYWTAPEPGSHEKPPPPTNVYVAAPAR
jgi:hypothetical protein